MMDRESIRLLQIVDSNCNDCKHMVRRNDRLEASKKYARHLDARHLVGMRRTYMEEINKRLEKGRDVSGLIYERARVTTNKGYRSGIAFGDCAKLNKPVQFIPNTCQLDTQTCFEHRRP